MMLGLAGLTACDIKPPASDGPSTGNPSIEGAQPAAYTVTFDTSSAGSGLGAYYHYYNTIGATIVTLETTEETGWCGVAEGTGEYYDNGWVAETHFPFTVKLCLHPSAQSLTVSIDRFCL
ncbi:MAG: hypothetical protein LBE83_05275, partial [Propionibacteriaceae bacterium]|nr:hypothetical protein [Propionibacteriaceae bacterium]